MVKHELNIQRVLKEKYWKYLLGVVCVSSFGSLLCIALEKALEKLVPAAWRR